MRGEERVGGEREREEERVIGERGRKRGERRRGLRERWPERN